MYGVTRAVAVSERIMACAIIVMANRAGEFASLERAITWVKAALYYMLRSGMTLNYALERLEFDQVGDDTRRWSVSLDALGETGREPVKDYREREGVEEERQRLTGAVEELDAYIRTLSPYMQKELIRISGVETLDQRDHCVLDGVSRKSSFHYRVPAKRLHILLKLWWMDKHYDKPEED